MQKSGLRRARDHRLRCVTTTAFGEITAMCGHDSLTSRAVRVPILGVGCQ
jgi:hypothetical protein